MAAAILPQIASAGGEAVAETAQIVRAKLDEFREEPVIALGKFFRKWGAISLGAGIFSYFISLAAKRAAQGFLADIDNVLGISTETPPTPPKPPTAAPPAAPPVPPPYLTQFSALVQALNAPDPVNAVAAVANFQSAISMCYALAVTVYGAKQTGTIPAIVVDGVTITPATPEFTFSQTPATTQIIVDAALSNGNIVPSLATTNAGGCLAWLIPQIAAMISELEGYHLSTSGESPGLNGPLNDPLLWEIANGALASYSFNPASGASSNWDGATAIMGNTGFYGANVKTTVNGLATCLGLTEPFALSAVGGTPSPNPWGPLAGVVGAITAVGSEIASGAETVGADVVQFGKDVSGVAVDVGTAIVEIGRAIMNFPRLLFDSVGFAFAWGTEMVLDYLWLPLTVIGGAMLGGSFLCLQVWPAVKTPVAARMKVLGASLSARVGDYLDRRLKIAPKVAAAREEQAKESVLESVTLPPAVAPPVVESSAVELPPPVEVPSPVPGEMETGVGSDPEEKGVAAMTPAEPPGIPVPSAEPTPTERTEEILGEAPNLREQKMKIAASAGEESGSAFERTDVPPDTLPPNEEPGEMVGPASSPADEPEEADLSADDILAAAENW
jgi:hypothetical protein